MIAVESCPACNGKGFVPFLVCKDHTVSRETFQLLQCDQCGLVITTPRPDSDQLGRYYISEEYISHTNKSASIIDTVYLRARRLTLRWKLRLLQTYSKPVAGTLLDYGCGTGEFLAAAKQNGYTVAGVEPSQGAREKALTITNAPIYGELQSLQTKTFDIITLWHVLEHVPDVNSVIDQLCAKLTHNGTIFIAVPNHNSADGKHYGTNWAGYDVPRHLWHFSKRTMNLLLGNHGLQIRHLVPMKLDAYYVSLLSEKYIDGKQTVTNMMRAFLKGASSNIKARKTGEYSSLIYIAQKK